LRHLVVVLSRQSLFVEGIASLLREQPQFFKVVVVDTVHDQDGFSQLIAIAPELIILDAFDKNLVSEFPLKSLLDYLPNTKIIQLNCNKDSIQLFKCEHWHMQESGSLISLIQNVVTE
jgi:DNA-binding NarL/FixJ family response regulator